jgi:ABC-type transporter Mla subunit MlaD
MNRRDYLRATVGTAATVGLSGCLDIWTGKEEPEPETDVMVDPSKVSDEPVSPEVEEATEHLIDAQSDLDEALNLIEKALSDFDGVTKTEAITVDTSNIQSRLDSVTESLTAAEPGAVESQQRFIDELRLFVASFEATKPVLDGVSTALDEYTTWETAIQTGALDEVSGALSAFTETGEAAFESLNEVKAPFNDVDPAVYIKADGMTEGRINHFVNEIDAVVSVLRALPSGMREFGDGVSAVVAARESMNADEFKPGSDSLENAVNSFDQALTEFRDAEDTVLQKHRPDVQAFKCASEAAHGASTAYLGSFNAVQDDDQEAVTAGVMDAQDALNACPYNLADPLFEPFIDQLL